MNKKIMPSLALIILIIIILLAFLYAKNSANQAVDFHNDSYVGAKKCKTCHEENYRSWSKTYHKTMTQEATSLSVLGNFNGENQTYWGFTIRPVIKNNRYYFEYYNPETGQLLNTLEIKRTVGSRRYQQYLAQTANTQGNYYRLELLWHIEDQRWVHLNGAFLGSDHQAFDNHTAIWNQNCIFCHNTGMKPNMTNYDEIILQTKAGKPLNLKVDSRFDSHVSDLGIGCESCHANGEEHIRLNQNPIRKYYLHYSQSDDKSIINPSKLSAKRSMDICGQCHGQRTPKNFTLARTWMESGPTYRPGDVLQSHVNPVLQSSQINDKQSDLFKQRFWSDGTPRLSAYEYQGLLQSTCHIKGDLTCNDCHSMHDGDPKGMIKNDMLTNKACLSCHQEYKNKVVEHTGHQLNSSGNLCYNCHMPKIVYGVMTFHRSHKIESPNALSEFINDKPNACVACHLDKPTSWIIGQSNRIWHKNDKKNKNTFTYIIQAIIKLHSGDPVERGIVANNMVNATDILPSDKLYFLIPHLLYSMEDRYPAIRRFSFKSLKLVLKKLAFEYEDFRVMSDSIKSFDFIADEFLRKRLIEKTQLVFSKIDKSQWHSPPKGSLLDNNYILNYTEVDMLRKLSFDQNKTIEIGE